MAKIENTVAVTGTLSTKDTNDTYPVVDQSDIRGSYRSVETLPEIENIPDEHRAEGMLVFVVESKTFYQYIEGQFRKTELSGGTGAGLTQDEADLLYLKREELIPNDNIPVSAEPDNIIEKKVDGLYVKGITEDDLADYVKRDEVLTNVSVSNEPDNAIEQKPDGLYVPKSTDAVVSISDDEGNKLENRDDGLYVNSVTIDELEEVDLSQYVRKDEIGDIDNIKTKISREEGNAIEEKDDGIYVSKSIEWVVD